jgi:hypothetical protein
VKSPNTGERRPLDLDRDVPTTIEDIAVLRQLSRTASSWLSLSAAEVDAMIPEGALDRRPLIAPDARPFTLPPD